MLYRHGGSFMYRTIFVTGASGFIGSNLCKRILKENSECRVIGLDNMNDYYDVRIKEARLNELSSYSNYTFIKGNLADKELINSILISIVLVLLLTWVLRQVFVILLRIQMHILKVICWVSTIF